MSNVGMPIKYQNEIIFLINLQKFMVPLVCLERVFDGRCRLSRARTTLPLVLPRHVGRWQIPRYTAKMRQQRHRNDMSSSAV